MKALGTKVIGVWDDHDFGINDGNRDFPLKNEVRELYLDFIEEPMDSVRRIEKNSTIHQDYVIASNDNQFLTHVILLDNRFEFDVKTSDHLGEGQWEWLDEALGRQDSADLTIIMSGLQIFADTADAYEKFEWSDKKRLMALLRKHKKSGVIFLTGDIHHAIILQSPCASFSNGYAIPEFTSSGMSHNRCLLFDLSEQMDYVILPLYSYDLPKEVLNYGHVTINTSTKEVQMQIRNIQNQPIF